ncbi:MAG: hypothetical protein WCS45_01910, partial [Clostridia bacterium]
CSGGCLVKILITVIIIAVIIGGALWWVSVQTPAKLGFADTEIGGTTLRQMGLAEVRIIDLIRIIRNLLKPDESKIVTNPYDPEKDKLAADNKLKDTSIPLDGEDPDYLHLLGEEPLTTTTPMLLELADTEIAYIMDAIINSSAEADEDLQVIRDLNAALVQVEITKGSTTTLGMMMAIDISSIKNDIPMGGGLLPDRIYLNSVNKLQAANDGIISTQSQGIEINGMKDETAKAVINALFNAIVKEENVSEEDPIKFFNDAFGAVFKRVINNIGLVGDAELDSNDEVIESTITYGNQGIEEHIIKVITRESI